MSEDEKRNWDRIILSDNQDTEMELKEKNEELKNENREVNNKINLDK